MQDETAEKILNDLMQKAYVRFHTNIKNPAALTSLEILGSFLKENFDEGLGGLILEFCSGSNDAGSTVAGLRVNSTAKDGHRARQIIEVLKRGAESDKKKSPSHDAFSKLVNGDNHA